jgi:isoamylase
MSEGDWSNGYARSIMVFLNGQAIPEPDRRGQPIRGDNILLIFNGHYESLDFTLPRKDYGASWLVEIDTAATSINKKIRRAGSTVRVEARSTLVLRGPADRGLIPPRGAAYAPLTRTMPS